MKLSLSILNCDLTNLKEDIKFYNPYLDYIHLDVMDGNFVPNISFGPDYIKSLKAYSNVTFDTHLMINNPKNYIKQFVDAGSDYITFHYEATDNVDELIEYIHSFNIKAGISIKPGTSVEVLAPYLSKLDLILIMSVEPGFGGQSFMPSSIDKVKWLRERQKDNNYLISIDGGINNTTIDYVKDYLDLAVVGSYITKAKDKVEAINSIKTK